MVALGINDMTGELAVLGWDEYGQPLQVIDNTPETTLRYFDSLSDPLSDLDVASSYDTLVITNRLVHPETEIGWTRQQSYNYIVNGDPEDAADGVGGWGCGRLLQ